MIRERNNRRRVFFSVDIKSNERSDDSYIGFAYFLFFLFRKSLKILMHLRYNALFEFS